MKDEQLASFIKSLSGYVTERAAIESLAWGEIISDLLRNGTHRPQSMTPGKKREALDYLFASAGSNAETLYNRLHGLVAPGARGSGRGCRTGRR